MNSVTKLYIDEKIVLTLGILLSAYSTYAMNLENQINEEEAWPCERVIDVYDHDGNWLDTFIVPC